MQLAADVTGYTDAPGGGAFRYFLRACNGADCSAPAFLEVTVTDSSGGGGGKPCRGKKCTN